MYVATDYLSGLDYMGVLCSEVILFPDLPNMYRESQLSHIREESLGMRLFRNTGLDANKLSVSLYNNYDYK